MDLLIKGGTLITGDGKQVVEDAAVWISNGRVDDVTRGSNSLPERPDVERVIDAKGCAVIPGVINAHAHACSLGPSMPSASRELPMDDIQFHLNRFLSQGTTTVLNVCGFALAEEGRAVDSGHPVNLRVATAHTPANVRAAQSVDGKGLGPEHLATTVEEQLEAGAAAIGEVGGGQTLGGGAQDYRFIPEALEEKTHVRVHPLQARTLKIAVLGRHLDGAGTSDEAVQSALKEIGLHEKLTVQEAKEIIESCVVPSLATALDGFREAAAAAEDTGYPAVFHNSTPTAKLLLELASKHPGAKLVAGHSNHNMFLTEEAVAIASEMKERGIVIDVSTLDCIQTRWRNSPENLDALIEAGLVDTVSTDFAGGHWDSILSGIHRIIQKEQLGMAEAIALATGNVARHFPHLAGDRGIIAKGKTADVVVSDLVNVSQVKHVVIGGKLVFYNGMRA